MQYPQSADRPSRALPWPRRLLAAIVMALAVTFAAPALAQVINYDLSTTSVMRVKLPISQAVTVTISDAVGKVVAADPTIADAQPITDKSIYLVGKAPGTTTVNLFSAAGAPVGLLAVEVGADTASMTRSIRAAVPASHVRVSSVNGRVLLSGTVPDAGSMQKVLDIVGQYGSSAVINTLTYVGGQQVNLEVRILEAQRDAGRQLGLSWDAHAGGVNFSSSGANATQPAAGASTFSSLVANVLAGGANIGVTINALETKGLVRTLADPNLTTLSGVSASFLAGGQIPIRTYDEKSDTVTLNYKDFGVKLVFTPVVLDGDRIQIHLTPEVSGLNGVTNGGDPIFSTRNLDATVELRDGQSFSVAGLLQNETNLSQQQLPWLGDVPILGSLFKSSSFQKHDTELVVIVTPRLVQPNTPTQTVASPLDAAQPANDAQFFALGQMEVTPKMLKSFQSGAGASGPYGYIMNLGDAR